MNLFEFAQVIGLRVTTHQVARGNYIASLPVYIYPKGGNHSHWEMPFGTGETAELAQMNLARAMRDQMCVIHPFTPMERYFEVPASLTIN